MKHAGRAASIVCWMAFQKESMSMAECKCNNGFSNVGTTIDRCFIEALEGCFIAASTLKLQSPNRNLERLGVAAQFQKSGKSKRGKIQLKLRSAPPQSFDIGMSSRLMPRRNHGNNEHPAMERNHAYANNHSLGANQRNGGLPEPSLNSVWPCASSPHQWTWAGRNHTGGLDAVGGYLRG